MMGPCPACHPSKFFIGHENPFENKAGLLWVGEKFYSVDSFTREAADLGISKRIKAIPRGFVAGKTWVFFAHMKGAMKVSEDDGNLFNMAPAIFMAARPRGFEKIVLESVYGDYKMVKGLVEIDNRSPEWIVEHHGQEALDNWVEIEELLKAGIKPVPVPDEDPDHNPKGTNGDENGTDGGE